MVMNNLESKQKPKMSGNGKLLVPSKGLWACQKRAEEGITASINI